MVTPVSLPRIRAFRDRGAASRGVSEIPLAVTVRRTACRQQHAAEVPAQFLCPISLEMMRDPVAAPTGITYDRESVEAWLERGRSTCPVTGRPLRLEDLVPNHATRRLIQDWCVVSGRADECAPTPRVPVSALDASELMDAVSAAAARGDGAACRELVARARALGKESERNRRCLASAGAATRALSSAFCLLSCHGQPGACRGGVLEEILAAIVVFSPLDADSMRRIACSPASLGSLVSIMSNAELLPHARTAAAVVLREIASSSDVQCRDAMASTHAIYAALINLLQNPVSAQATKAALVTAYYLATTRAELAAPRMVELGIVRILVELLVDCDKGTTEKALAALDALLLTVKARAEAYLLQALAVPVLVKRMHHVSDMATEFAVSALWRLCKNDDGGSCKAEALQDGAFQKLLLLLQVGCEGVARERASELLRMLNGSREDGAECIDTVDFKALKRPF